MWRVYGFIAYRVDDRATAEDLTQLTFERALRAWSRFDRSKASEITWLLAIARNVIVDHHRRDRAAQLEPLEDHHAPSVGGPEEGAASAELITALAQLSERDREVIALRFGGDMTGPEIAQLLGLTLSNVQQILSRSLRRLRQVLGGAESALAPDDAQARTHSAP